MVIELTRQERQRARRAALQGLYQLDIQRVPADASVAEILAHTLTEAGLEGGAADHARNLAAGTWAASARYDEMIREAARHWDVGRMPAVDRNVLRLALHELLEHPDVPARVIIDEAIEIGREFGSAETSQFVNGVLDAIWKAHPAMKIARAGEERKT
jgi:transcription antitermination protein NusB